jgi:hypothetical protein
MAYIRKGLGQAASLFCPADPETNCKNTLTYYLSPCCWSLDMSVAVPKVPTAAQLANPNADEVISELVNQQFAAQQAIDAAGVQETLGSEIEGGLYQAGQAAANAGDAAVGFSKTLMIALAIAAGGLLLLAVRR